MKDNLVPIRKDATGIAHYDSKKDTLYIPAQKAFPSYADYVQEVTRQIVHATGVPQRLGREGLSVDGVLAVTLGNSLNGALLSTGTAGDTSVSDDVSHGYTSIFRICILRL